AAERAVDDGIAPGGCALRHERPGRNLQDEAIGGLHRFRAAIGEGVLEAGEDERVRLLLAVVGHGERQAGGGNVPERATRAERDLEAVDVARIVAREPT